jgi:hypothetical protein
VGGCPDGPVYLAGDDGRVFRRTEEGFARVDGTGDEPWSSIACDDGRVVIAGRRGGTLLIRGRRSVRLESGAELALHAVAGADGAATWLAGDGGRLAVLARDRLRILVAGPTDAFQDATMLGGSLVAVGEWGRIARDTPDGLKRAESPTELGLAAVVPVAEDRLVAFGDRGVAVEIRWDRTRLLDPVTEASVRDAIADDGTVLAVGTRGAVLRGPPDSLAETRLEGAPDLWGVAGVPSNAVAVGASGTVRRVGSTGSRSVPCAVDVILRDVARLDGGTWAVGDRGAIVRIEDDGPCVIERAPAPDRADLFGIGPGPRGRALAVGRGGVMLSRSEPSGGDRADWAPAPVDVAGAHLRAVLATSRSVYVVGSRGVVLRHVRLDLP